MDTLLLGSLYFGCAGVLAFILINVCFIFKIERGGRTRFVKLILLLVTMATFSAWLMWITMYMAQINPMITPIKHGSSSGDNKNVHENKIYDEA